MTKRNAKTGKFEKSVHKKGELPFGQSGARMTPTQFAKNLRRAGYKARISPKGNVTVTGFRKTPKKRRR